MTRDEAREILLEYRAQLERGGTLLRPSEAMSLAILTLLLPAEHATELGGCMADPTPGQYGWQD